MTKKQDSERYQSGFSLVELMVALTIFSIVMTISTGTLLVFIDGNAKAQSENTAITNLTFALDSMTRNIRTGKDFHCANWNTSSLNSEIEDVTNPQTDECPGGGTGLAFTPGFQGSVRMGYRFNTDRGVIEQRIHDESVVPEEDTGWLAITSAAHDDTGVTGATTIRDFTFVVSGSDNFVDGPPFDEMQPTVSLSIEGVAGSGQGVTESQFSIQTFITQRVLDF